MSPIIRVLVAVIATFAAGLAAYLFVDANASSWYAGLEKPVFTPPDWVFAVVWIILYALMAGALAIMWTKGGSENETWVRFYFVQLLFNVAWTIFFFGLHATFVSLIDVLILEYIILALIAGAVEVDKRVAYLLAPYSLWLFFVTYINLAVWFLN